MKLWPFSLKFIGRLMVMALTIILLSGPPLVRAAETQASPQAAGDPTEVWRLGFTFEGTADYATAIGRLASNVASFRSNRGVANIYFAFPPAASAKTVQAASVYIITRTGTYSGDATLALKVFSLAGVAQRTVSATSLDLETAATGAWTALTLSPTSADLALNAGEYLAFEMTLSVGSGDDLDVRPMFSVQVQ